MTNASGLAICAATGATVALDSENYLVTLRKLTDLPTRPPDIDHLVVRESALDELDVWLEGGK